MAFNVHTNTPMMNLNKSLYLSLLMTLLLCSSHFAMAKSQAPIVLADGGSHTSSGGDLVITPTTDTDISLFLHNSNEWAHLIWLQRTLLVDFKYLLDTDLIKEPGNFFLINMQKDKDVIIQQLRAVNHDEVLEKLRLVLDYTNPDPFVRLMFNSESRTCIVDGKHKAASIRYVARINAFAVCIDYANIKAVTNKETFELYLMSLITHELVHIWNDEFLDKSLPNYTELKEVLPNYFQRLVLAYFSHSRHIHARNSIHKLYSWVSETLNVFTHLKTSWQAELGYERKYRSTNHFDSAEFGDISSIHRNKMGLFCDTYLNDSIFPSDWIINLDNLKRLFLKEGLIEVPIVDFTHLTNTFYHLALLKYYCDMNIEKNRHTRGNLFTDFFNSIPAPTSINPARTFFKIDQILVTLEPERSHFPHFVSLISNDLEINNSDDFRRILNIIISDLEHVYSSQKSELTLK